MLLLPRLAAAEDRGEALFLRFLDELQVAKQVEIESTPGVDRELEGCLLSGGGASTRCRALLRETPPKAQAYVRRNPRAFRVCGLSPASGYHLAASDLRAKEIRRLAPGSVYARIIAFHLERHRLHDLFAMACYLKSAKAPRQWGGVLPPDLQQQSDRLRARYRVLLEDPRVPVRNRRIRSSLVSELSFVDTVPPGPSCR